jgi:3-oxoacyl-[acyl-carrier protein] reductase
MSNEGGGRLQDRAAIVTGSGRGIGRGIAEVLAREGANVVIADLDEQTGAEAARSIGEQFGGETHFVPTDVADRSAIEGLVAATVERFGRVDILCHNVGIYPPVALEEMTEADWDRVLNVNLKSAFFAVSACIPHMKAQGGGKIAFTSSVTGPMTALPGEAHYGASKAGLLGFMRAAALELAPYNINVNAVMPGTVMTPGLTEAEDPGVLATLPETIPLGRIGRPTDIGHAMLFLVSDDAEYITGQTIIVDGGATLIEE